MQYKPVIVSIILLLGLQSSTVDGKENHGQKEPVNFVCYTHDEEDLSTFDVDFAKLIGPSVSDAVCADALVASGRELAFSHGNGLNTHDTPMDCVKAVPEG